MDETFSNGPNIFSHEDYSGSVIRSVIRVVIVIRIFISILQNRACINPKWCGLFFNDLLWGGGFNLTPTSELWKHWHLSIKLCTLIKQHTKILKCLMKICWCQHFVDDVIKSYFTTCFSKIPYGLQLCITFDLDRIFAFCFHQMKANTLFFNRSSGGFQNHYDDVMVTS